MKTRTFSMLAVLAIFVLGGCRSEKTEETIEQQSPQERVVKAIADNEVETLRLLLTESRELANAANKNGTTLLHYAAKVSTDPAIIQTLLEFGVDPSLCDNKKQLPIHYAIHNRNTSALNVLLRQAVEDGSYPNLQISIPYAIRYNADAATLKILLDKCDDHWVATSLTLTAARYNDDPEVMRLILERGGDANASDGHATAMHYAAAKSPSTLTLQYLYERFGKIDTRQPKDYENPGWGTPNTPLHYAAKSNPNVEISQWLVEHGADPFARNSSGETPCEYAFQYNTNMDVVKFYFARLKEGGESNIDKQRLLNAAQESPNRGTFSFLVREFLDPVAVKGTPLSQYMPYYGQMDPRIWDVLLEYEVDLHGKNEAGHTAFEIAQQYDNYLEYGNVPFVETLKELEIKHSGGNNPIK